jgi:hypothetical protein
VSVVSRERPAGGADADVVERGRVGWDGRHGDREVSVSWIRRILLSAAIGSEAPWILGP